MPTLPNACILRTPTPLAPLVRSPVHVRIGGIAATFAARHTATMSAQGAVTENGQKDHCTTTMPCETSILPIDASKLGTITLSRPCDDALLEDWDISWAASGPDIARLRQAAAELHDGALPVAFPTETVYGLGADATNSQAVRAIYAAKQRPVDNPLIVHVASLRQLASILRPSFDDENERNPADLVPKIYHPLIRRFWPGPLTLILPLPNAPSSAPLAPEVTAGLSTFGARMPGSLIALLLIRLADRPLAGPSANASTKPSPTAAEHVAHDLRGRVATILDGGPCDVGVESTVVDGVSGDTPVILRPGGVSIDELRRCEGWERVGVAYKDKAEMSNGEGKESAGEEDGEKTGEPAVKKRKKEAPRAPGMKYRHYSPKARVVLFEAGTGLPNKEAVEGYTRVGTIRTKKWPRGCGLSLRERKNDDEVEQQHQHQKEEKEDQRGAATPMTNGTGQSQHRGFSKMLDTLTVRPLPKPQRLLVADDNDTVTAAVEREVWDVNLGAETKDIARGLFSALRELDKKDVDVILVEGIDEREGDVAAAVMNRLRKAAEVEVKGS
ncbi:hypothetical protein SLS54_001196 [Diplodia seriata]